MLLSSCVLLCFIYMRDVEMEEIICKTLRVCAESWSVDPTFEIYDYASR